MSILYPVPMPNYQTWTKTNPQKKECFWSNPYKVEVVITSLIARVTKLWSHEHIYNIIWITWQNFVDDFIGKNYDTITSLSKYHYFKKAWVSYFSWYADIIKIKKKSLKTQKELKGLETMYQNAIYICISWHNKICWFLVKKCWCQQNSGGMLRDPYIFWVFFR